MIENYIRQYCKKHKYTRIKYKQVIDNCHILSILIKLAIIGILSFYFVTSAVDWISNTVYTYGIGNNNIVQLDQKHTEESMILTSIIAITFTVMCILDMIDLMLWWERTNRDLIISVLGNLLISVFIIKLYVDMTFIQVIGISILEPSVYVFIFLVLYKKFQYKNKIYHKIKGESIQ